METAVDDRIESVINGLIDEVNKANGRYFGGAALGALRLAIADALHKKLTGEVERLTGENERLREERDYEAANARLAGTMLEHHAQALAMLRPGHDAACNGNFASHSVEGGVIGSASNSIYFASKTCHANKWKKLRGEGVPVISTWIDEAGVGESKSLEDLWTRCVSEASAAAVTILYAEDGDELKGAFLEAGAALGNGRWLIVVGARRNWSFVNHPKAIVASSLEVAVDCAMAILRRMGYGADDERAKRTVMPMAGPARLVRDENGNTRFDAGVTTPIEALNGAMVGPHEYATGVDWGNGESSTGRVCEDVRAGRARGAVASKACCLRVWDSGDMTDCGEATHGTSFYCKKHLIELIHQHRKTLGEFKRQIADTHEKLERLERELENG